MSSILSKKKTINELQNIDPILFEEFIADVWRAFGFNVNLRKATGDRGIDVEAKLGEKLYLIQAKRYSPDNKVGSQEVRNYATLYQQVPEADSVLIITTSKFTTEARKLANDLDVDVIDSNELFNIIDQYAADVAVEYLQDLSNQNSSAELEYINQRHTIDDVNPFETEGGFREIRDSQGFFDSCPECTQNTIWFAQEKKRWNTWNSTFKMQLLWG